jgi:hypothetical protein
VYIEIFQIQFKLDKETLLMFRDLQAHMEACGRVEAERYVRVFEGEVPEGKHDALEDVFVRFNSGRPVGFRGRSMSVGDVVHVVKAEGVKPGFYFCDMIGFKKIQFLRGETIK